jgi:hypothetical protein
MVARVGQPLAQSHDYLQAVLLGGGGEDHARAQCVREQGRAEVGSLNIMEGAAHVVDVMQVAHLNIRPEGLQGIASSIRAAH